MNNEKTSALHKKAFQILLLLCVIATGLAGWYLYEANTFDSKWKISENAPIVAKVEEEQKITVFVTGAVKKPGVYELPSGSHVYEAVEAAGNVLPYGDAESVNMSQTLEDGTHVSIKLNPDQVNPAAAGLVNINMSDVKELETLPGVGESTAQKIVDYRKEHGSFTSIEQLKEISGIGEAKFKKMADKVTL